MSGSRGDGLEGEGRGSRPRSHTSRISNEICPGCIHMKVDGTVARIPMLIGRPGLFGPVARTNT